MTNNELARSYLFKAAKRLKVLNLLLEAEDFFDSAWSASRTRTSPSEVRGMDGHDSQGG